MKKVILSVFAVITFATVSAQKRSSSKATETTTETATETGLVSQKGENYLPEEGDWAIGFNANSIFKNLATSFNGNTADQGNNQINLRKGAFVGKYFVKEDQAYRVVVNLGFGSNTTTTPGATDEVKLKTSSFDLQLGLGKEWRKGKTRLQGYYGADAIIGFNSGGKETTTTTRTAALTPNSVITTESVITDKSGSIVTVGVNGFIGAEYFILPKLALGAQYQWGLGVNLNGKSSTSSSATSVVTNASSAVTNTTVTSASSEGGKSTGFFLGGVGTASLNLTLHF